MAVRKRKFDINYELVDKGTLWDDIDLVFK